MYTTYFLSHDPIKIVEFKKYSNKLNQNKNISKKTYFCMHFEMCKSNLKATLETYWHTDKEKDRKPVYSPKNR